MELVQADGSQDRLDVEADVILINADRVILGVAQIFLFTTPKSGKPRTLTPAPAVMQELKAQRRRQLEMQLRAGPEWDNPHGLVFTNATGRNLFTQYVNNHFRALAEAAGLEGVRFHDLRHTYTRQPGYRPGV